MAKKQSAPGADVAFDDLTFEQAFHQLEEIVAQLEQGDLPLDQSLDLHARGQKLAEFCAKQLDSAELKVKEIRE
jgi:exodeoxyribonuclease VII small subunit